MYELVHVPDRHIYWGGGKVSKLPIARLSFLQNSAKSLLNSVERLGISQVFQYFFKNSQKDQKPNSLLKHPISAAMFATLIPFYHSHLI